MTHLIFCHGFGYSPHYWSNLTPLLPDFTSHQMDLGYYGDLVTPQIPKDTPVIGVGHSLGLLKLMQQPYNFTALIGLNGFVNFLGNDPFINQKRTLELDAFELLIKTAPKMALSFFHKRCGVVDSGHNLNKNRLLEDITVLRQPVAVPQNLTIVATLDDIVCPPDLIQDNFAPNQIYMLESGGHGLGSNHPDVIATIIKRSGKQP